MCRLGDAMRDEVTLECQDTLQLYMVLVCAG